MAPQCSHSAQLLSTSRTNSDGRQLGGGLQAHRLEAPQPRPRPLHAPARGGRPRRFVVPRIPHLERRVTGGGRPAARPRHGVRLRNLLEGLLRLGGCRRRGRDHGALSPASPPHSVRSAAGLDRLRPIPDMGWCCR